jgi:hypothetical protein
MITQAEEKAKELVDRFFNKHAYMTLEMAIQCALICVDEISKSIIWSSDFNGDKKRYWQEVKKAIEKL